MLDIHEFFSAEPEFQYSMATMVQVETCRAAPARILIWYSFVLRETAPFPSTKKKKAERSSETQALLSFFPHISPVAVAEAKKEHVPDKTSNRHQAAG